MDKFSSNKKASVVIERMYRATVRELWDLWTTKEGFESWWGPQGFRVEVHEIDPRVGGALMYDMIADTHETIAALKWGVPRLIPRVRGIQRSSTSNVWSSPM